MRKFLFLLLGITMMVFFSGCACLHCGAFIAKDNIAVNNGYNALEGRDYAAAESYLNEALSCNSNNAHAILYLGVVYHKTNRSEQACEMYTKLIGMNPDVKSVHGNSQGRLLTDIAKENLEELRADCPKMDENAKGPCLNCPPVVKVDMDSDGDGVVDSKDKCPDTPKGCAVDSDGCPLDSDGDGVIDCRDNCPDTPKGVSVDDRGCWVISAVLLFEFDKADLKREAKEVLDKGCEILKQSSIKIEIQGYTCDMGSEAYNQRLSERRAEAVKSYLIEKDIDENRLTAVGYGENNPAASNDTENGRKKNRRVEFKAME